MLPKHHYDKGESETFNDSDWIAARLDELPISIQKDVCKKYSDIYLKLTTDKDRKARFRANTWLRNVVGKYKIQNQEGYF